MFAIDQMILFSAILILLGIVSSKASARLGLPVLVLFLFVGMLAGERGIGGVAFDNPELAHALGTLALVMILYDGGLQTPLSSIKSVWRPASLLATLGVLITALVTGLAAAWILDLPILMGLLIGSIVGSTDAAAVFAQLRNSGIHIRARLKSTLEVESASNDPMAIFLTVGLLEVLVNDLPLGFGLLQMFGMQMGIGAAVGIGIGYATVGIINRAHLQATGMYPVLVAACGLLAFGLAANLGGSGFLAVFIAGVIVGNSRFAFQRSTLFFHDGLAWLSQITMFVVLGLLVDPKALLEVWSEGLVIATVLVLLARPLAVIPIMLPFGFSRRETALVSWVGLRGSVPIVLAIFPLMFGLPGAPLIFNVVFFVVLMSAIVQGSTLAWLARRLGLAEDPPATAAATLEITSISNINTDIVEYTLAADSRAVGMRLSQMALPVGVVIAMITRGKDVIPPRGSTSLAAGDHLFVVLRPDTRAFVDRAFSQKGEIYADPWPSGELRLKGTTKVEDVHRSYGLRLPAAAQDSLEAIVLGHLEQAPSIGTWVSLGDTKLCVREVVGARLATIGVVPAKEVGTAEA